MRGFIVILDKFTSSTALCDIYGRLTFGGPGGGGEEVNWSTIYLQVVSGMNVRAWPKRASGFYLIGWTSR
jgi:hypothetical protein